MGSKTDRSLSSITRSKAVYPFFARRVTSAPWFSRYLTISLFLWKKEKARVRPTERESMALLLGNMSGGFNYSSISAPVKGLGNLCLPALVPYTVASHDRNQSLSVPSTNQKPRALPQNHWPPGPHAGPALPAPNQDSCS